VDRKDFFRVQPDSEEGIVIMNPPYGERIGKANIDDFYRGIGDWLKKAFTGHQAWILSSNREAMKYLGLRPHKRLVLFNGPLECQYSGFRLYRGSMKSKYRNEAT
jgi:putative N6-adenine-specific DNA methylase